MAVPLKMFQFSRPLPIARNDKKYYFRQLILLSQNHNNSNWIELVWHFQLFNSCYRLTMFYPTEVFHIKMVNKFPISDACKWIMYNFFLFRWLYKMRFTLCQCILRKVAIDVLFIRWTYSASTEFRQMVGRFRSIQNVIWCTKYIIIKIYKITNSALPKVVASILTSRFRRFMNKYFFLSSLLHFTALLSIFVANNNRSVKRFAHFPSEKTKVRSTKSH